MVFQFRLNNFSQGKLWCFFICWDYVLWNEWMTILYPKMFVSVLVTKLEYFGKIGAVWQTKSVLCKCIFAMRIMFEFYRIEHFVCHHNSDIIIIIKLRELYKSGRALQKKESFIPNRKIRTRDLIAFRCCFW